MPPPPPCPLDAELVVALVDAELLALTHSHSPNVP